MRLRRGRWKAVGEEVGERRKASERVEGDGAESEECA